MDILVAVGAILGGLLAAVSGVITLSSDEVAVALFGDSSMARATWSFIWILVGLATIIISIISFCRTVKNGCHKHCLDYGSKKYVKFFSKWYSKQGPLHIICNDIKWTTEDANKEIFDKMKEKCGNGGLQLFLAEGVSLPAVLELKRAGAAVFSIPSSYVNRYTFSCQGVMGNPTSSVIVRDKNEDHGGTIVVEEVQNRYVAGLLNEILRDWRQHS